MAALAMIPNPVALVRSRLNAWFENRLPLSDQNIHDWSDSRVAHGALHLA